MSDHEELLIRWRAATTAIDDWKDAHKPKIGRPNIPKRRGATNRLRNAAKDLAELLTDLVEKRERLPPRG